MSTIQRSPFNPSDYPGPSSLIDSMSPGERWAHQQEMLKAEPMATPIIEDAIDGMGRFGLGLATSFVGYTGLSTGLALGSTDEDIEFSTPLNLGDEDTEDTSSIAFISGLTKRNNAKAITKDLLDNNVAFDDYAYILSSRTYGEYQNRLIKVKLASEEAKQEGGFLGRAVGTASDTASLILMGMTTEPLFMAGMGGKIGAAASGISEAAMVPRWGQMVKISEEAARAATLASRTGLATRGLAIGLAEESAIQLAKNEIDPTYRPDIGSVMFDYTISGSAMAAIGGMAGRMFVKEEIEKVAKMKYHTARMGNIEIGFHSPLAFVSEAHADDILLRGSAQTAKAAAAESIAAYHASKATYKAGKDFVMDILSQVEARGGTISPEMVEALYVSAAKNSDGFRLNTAQVINDISPFIGDTTRSHLLSKFSSKTIGGSADYFGNIRKVSSSISIEDDLFARFNDMTTPFYGAEGTVRAPATSSIILQVANEIRKRGGNVTKEEFNKIISEVRELLSNPPMRTNTKGKKVLDSRMRMANLAQLINSRVPQASRTISIPKALQSRLKGAGPSFIKSTSLAATGTAGTPGVPGASATPVGGGATQLNIEMPQLFRWIDTLPFGLHNFFNQGANVLLSNNPVARSMGWMMFNARRAAATPAGVEVAQGHTIFEQGTYQLAGYMQQFLTTYRNGYTRFALNRGAGDAITLMDSVRAAYGPGSRATRRAFDEAVMYQVRAGTFNHANDGVNAAARQVAGFFSEMEQLAQAHGVAGFTGGVSNYFPRIYNWEDILRISRSPNGMDELTRLMENALNNAPGGRQLLMPDGTLQAIPDVPAAARALANRLRSLAINADQAPLLDIDQQFADALNDMLAPLAPAGTARTPRGRPRIIMDELGSITTVGDILGRGNTLSIADITSRDLPDVMRKYMTSVMGAVNERRLINDFNAMLNHYQIMGAADAAGVSRVAEVETFEEMLGIANRLGEQHPEMGLLSDSTTESLRELMSALRYEPLYRSSNQMGSLNRFGNRLLSTLMPFGYLSTGGAFGLAQIGETARVVGTFGLAAAVKQMPIMGEMVENWRNMDEGTQNLAMFIDQAFHPSGDRLRRHLFGSLEHDAFSHGTFKRGLDAAANAFSDLSLLAPSTSFTQHFAAATSLQHLYDVSAGTARRLDDATIRTLGLEPNQYDEIVNWVGRNADLRAGSDRVINLRNIGDPQMDLLRVFVDRTVRTRIQDMPTRGDFHKSAFTFWGRLFTQFRTFNLKGIDNFLYQNISRARRGGALQSGQEIMSTMVFASLIQYARAWADAKSYRDTGEYEKARRIEESQLGMAGLLKGGLSGPSEFFLPILATDATWGSLVSDDPIFSPYRYSGLQWYGIPGAAMAYRAASVGKDVYGAIVAKGFGFDDREREITRQTVHNARLLFWGQNAPVVKQLFNLAEDEIGKSLLLRDKQPR